jgi:hypothetical protein
MEERTPVRAEYKITIDAMQRDIGKHEQAVAELKATVNKLCELDSEPPLYPDPQKRVDHSLSSHGRANEHRSPAPLRRRAKAAEVIRTRKSVRPFILNTMNDGAEWGTAELKASAIKQGVPGVDDTTLRTVFHGTLLALKAAGQVEQTDNPGMWRIVSNRVVPIKGAA